MLLLASPDLFAYHSAGCDEDVPRRGPQPSWASTHDQQTLCRGPDYISSSQQPMFTATYRAPGHTSLLGSLQFCHILTCSLCCLQLVIERAAAVVGNLSTTDQFFSAIREAGAIQRLVRLLDSGSTHRTTEIAAKTLANLASESSNRKLLRLAGGVPPLMRLLMDKPSGQVRSSPWV